MEKNKPLVSVGIPTYNRPEGLKRTLEQITAQTYKNIEIIVSDNGSPSNETEEVAREFIKKDNRIQFFRQPENKGALFNFQFVLEKATGEYFMWAADDDEWDQDFIKQLLSIIGPNGGAMCGYAVRNRETLIDKRIKTPEMRGIDKVGDAMNFIYNMQPSLIYGIFKRQSLAFSFQMDSAFDFADVCIVFNVILNDGFYSNDTQKIFYHAGIDAKDYVFKPANPKEKRRFSYSMFFKFFNKIIFKSGLRFKHKLLLVFHFLIAFSSLFISHEGKTRNRTQVVPMKLLYHSLIFIKKVVYGATSV